MTTKLCTICKLEKNIDEFGNRKQKKSITVHSWCKQCYRIKRKEYDKRDYDKNIEVNVARSNEYNKTHRDNIRERKKKNRQQPHNRIHRTISSAITQHIKRNESSKGGKSIFDFLPYNKPVLLKHIQSLFEPWMIWNNYGAYDKNTWNDNDPATWTWQIDHIVPQSTFQYSSMNERAFQDCWALTNLRPLSSKQNYLDGIKRIRHVVKQFF